MKYRDLAIKNANDLIFGNTPHPVTTKRGLVIGGGRVYPELNFTLPSIEVSPDSKEQVIEHYRQITTGALERAKDLYSQGVVLELETVIEMTKYPDIGVGVVKTMNEICEEYYQKHQLPTEIRLTPNDLREFDRPPRQRTGAYLDPMMQLFEEGAKAGGNLLSIESTGGKEISDDALMMCNMTQFIFSQAVLGVRDMHFLWDKIADVAGKTGVLMGGDTACGFGNTAMVLAEKKYIPKIFAAVARVATVVRTLVAVEHGATGPDKDCGYEGPFLKAIAGIPISMEGKTAACAHLSPVGNIAAACCDLWSNESVQNIKLLAGFAPTVYLEQLEYDCRLMNQAVHKGHDACTQLQELMVNSDISYDPQALVLAPESVIEISKEIVKGNNYIEACVLGCLKSVEIIDKAYKQDKLTLNDMELTWIDMLRSELEAIPFNEEKFIDLVVPTLDQNKILLNEYGIT
ncbi:MAG: methanol--corrinoid methyltransferase [Bacteroidetes bacterium]|jgi:methanol--5-hydroxybenzimidazolylcobamide Co-methyltransferase|nr:methanol--corrinoid methyltransferase [Bacteroidota bacterium]